MCQQVSVHRNSDFVSVSVHRNSDFVREKLYRKATPSVITTANSDDVWESINGCNVPVEGIVPLTWVIYVRGNAH